jgi:signal transduction histidine kinase
VDVAALVEELGSSLSETAARRAVTFALDTQVDGVIESDGRHLRQILSALFGYAVKASRRGSQVTATVAHAAARLRAEVRSTGITPGDPALLFADRRGATPGVPQPYRGPGLGLPLIGRVVVAWGGRVTAEQRDGALVLGVEVPVR